MKLLFTGGGTMGSVIPLLAIAEELKDKNPDIDFYWVGTKDGPEKFVVREYNIEFREIASGKLRRYFSLVNFLDIFKIIFGFFQSFIILVKLRPRVIVSAGGYVAVPVVWAGWLFGIPSLIHQQDVRAGLANKLCAKAAKMITVCFSKTAKQFNQKKVEVVGNPVRGSLNHSKAKSLEGKLDLRGDLPIVLVMGGGRGSETINRLVEGSISELAKFAQVVHITGKFKVQSSPPISSLKNSQWRKTGQPRTEKSKVIDNYIIYNFIIDSTEVLKSADLIISRAGMGTLTEIAYLSKPSIIIPIPDSHQVENAKYFADRGGIEFLKQKELNEDKFIKSIKNMLDNRGKMKELGENVHKIIKWGAEKEIAKIILNL